MKSATTNNSEPVLTTTVEQNIGVITINYPPVNALGQAVREGLLKAIEQLENDENCKVIIIQCIGRTFIAGADIREFGSPPLEPHLPFVVNRIESCAKPVIASLYGTTLGGGLEVALACHFRVALASAKVGLPEVNLGLIPGAGGTQRLMRIVGIEQALEMITSGKHCLVTHLQDTGLFDAIFSDNSEQPNTLSDLTRAFAKQLIVNDNLTVNPVGKRKIVDSDFNWEAAKAIITKKARGRIAPIVAFNVMQKSIQLDINEGMAVEREAFVKLLNSDQSAALRHAFAAEKKVSKIATTATALEVKSVGIIGGGTMGVGIATAFLARGYNIILIEQTEDTAKNAFQRIKANLDSNVDTGRMSLKQATDCIERLVASSDKNTLVKCELVIEAIFENMSVKKALFEELDEICSDQTLFATNTSYLDINEIAAASKYPERVIGMHFFSPANIMKLLEIVKADHSSDQAIATAMAVGKKLGKVTVLVKVCFGFAANRMYSRYAREAQQMLLEGATVEQVDKAITEWGMAMGPLAVQDLAGIDIGYKARSTRAFPKHDPGYFKPSSLMVENNRLGRKTKAGFYRYDEQGKAQPDTVVQQLIEQSAESLEIEPHQFTNEEIVNRLLMAITSEAFQLAEEGIVQRLSDIDVIWMHGYGFPRYRGGPIFYAKQLGADKLKAEMKKLQQQFGLSIWPEINYDYN